MVIADQVEQPVDQKTAKLRSEGDLEFLCLTERFWYGYDDISQHDRPRGGAIFTQGK